MFFVLVVSLGWSSGVTSYALGAGGTAQPGSFQITAEWHLGGAGGWGRLVVDPGAKHLFVPRSDRVVIVDTVTGHVSGQVTGFVGAHDIALDERGKYGYVSDLTDGSAGFVRVFDRTTLQILASIAVGRTPDRIAFDASTNKVFVFDGSAHTATVIDGGTNKVVATIALPARPGSTVSNGRGSIFVAIRSLSEILRIDTSIGKITAAWPLAPCDAPSGLTIDTTQGKIFAACENQKLIAIDAVSGATSLISEIPKGAGDVSFDALRHLLFVSSGAGTLTIFRGSSPGRFTKLQELTALPSAQTLAVNSTDGAAYLAVSKFGQRTGAISEELRYRPTPIDGSFTVVVVASHAKLHSSASIATK